MSKDKDKFFTMRIPTSFHSEIKAFCALKEITMKEFCVDSLLKGLKETDANYVCKSDLLNNSTEHVNPLYISENSILKD